MESHIYTLKTGRLSGMRWGGFSRRITETRSPLVSSAAEGSTDAIQAEIRSRETLRDERLMRSRRLGTSCSSHGLEQRMMGLLKV